MNKKEGGVGLEAPKGARWKKRLKLRYPAYLFCGGVFLLFIFNKIISLPQNAEKIPPPSPEKLGRAADAEKTGSNSKAAPSSRKPSVVRIDLLKNLGALRTENAGAVLRNPFRPSGDNSPAPPKKEAPPEAEPAKPEKPKIDIRLMGIMEDRSEPSAKGIVRFAFLSVGKETMIVRQGDVVAGQYEIVSIDEESVEMRNKETGQVEKITLEKEACHDPQS